MNTMESSDRRRQVEGKLEGLADITLNVNKWDICVLVKQQMNVF